MSIGLSPDQAQALDDVDARLQGHNEAILTGAAGTGKTTVLKEFLLRRAKSRLICFTPTWKAALRFKEVVGVEAVTLHSLLYGKPIEAQDQNGTTDLKFTMRRPAKGAIPGNSTIVVDEASMLGRKVYRDLMAVVEQNTSKVLFIGDKEQLEPPKDTWGPDLDNPTAALTKVHRQASNSTLLSFLTAVRERRIDDFREYDETCRWVPGTQATIENFLRSSTPEQAGEQNIIITYTNALRRGVNRMARRVMGATAPLLPNDPLLSFSNEAGLVNGELVKVASLDADQHKDPLWRSLYQVLSREGIEIQSVWVKPPGRPEHRVFVFPQFLTTDRQDVTTQTLMGPILDRLEKFRLVEDRRLKSYTPSRHTLPENILNLYDAASMIADVDYGYACTAHKAQGSQWPNVLVLVENKLRYAIKKEGAAGIDFGRRWLYTAGSRAQTSVQLAYMP